MSRFVQEPDKPKAVDPMVAVFREQIGQIRFGNNVAERTLAKIDSMSNAELVEAVKALAVAVQAIVKAIESRPEIKLTKTITIKKTANQEWKATVDR